MRTFLTILIVILVILLAALVALYFFGRKMETKQVESQAAMEAAKQTVSMLIIDKKKLITPTKKPINVANLNIIFV